MFDNPIFQNAMITLLVVGAIISLMVLVGKALKRARLKTWPEDAPEVVDFRPARNYRVVAGVAKADLTHDNLPLRASADKVKAEQLETV